MKFVPLALEKLEAFGKQENVTWTGQSESPNDNDTLWYVSF